MPPPPNEPRYQKTLEQIVDEVGVYSADAYGFVQEGLTFAVQHVHGRKPDREASTHISGQQLCEGLRTYALARWGLMAGTVLRWWGITSTMDFGRIVYILIENGRLSRTDEDTIEDFRNVYDFRNAFETKYRIPSIPSKT
jgi:uncharacterized repeat protein (TIGR04138 family)